MHDRITRLESSRIALRISFGLVPLLAGLDKFTYFLTDWSAYVGPFARSLLPVSPQTFLYVVGIVEVLVGLAVLTRLHGLLLLPPVIVWLGWRLRLRWTPPW